MNETKSKALLIVSLIAILAVSSLVVVLHTLYPPEHELIELLRVERTEFVGSNIWYRWFGNETKIGINVETRHRWRYEGQPIWIYSGESWTVAASYGHIFNITIPDGYWCSMRFFDEHVSVRSNGTLRF
jgi:hypothetical protein